MKITANTVTLLRILLLPLPCVLFTHHSTLHQWIAFFLLVGLGCTDFVDGWLARAQGPTHLGALLDPVADKIFTACVVLLYIAKHMVHPALGIMILGREFMMISLRGGLLWRGCKLPVSAAGKLKTIFQMGGFGTIFLTVFSPTPWSALIPMALALCFFVLAQSKGNSSVSHRHSTPPKALGARPRSGWIMPVALALAVVALLNIMLTPPLSASMQAVVIVVLTWQGGLDYLQASTRLIHGCLGAADGIRLAWAITYSLAVVPWVVMAPQAVLPLIAAIGTAFTLGGLVNAVSATNRQATVLPSLGISTLAGCLFCLGGIAAILWHQPLFFPLASWLLCVVNVLACTFIAWRGLRSLLRG